MLINKDNYHTIWLNEKSRSSFSIIDQRLLPHELVIMNVHTSDVAASVIKDMAVRGAPLIGVTAAFGFYLGTLEASQDNFDSYISTVFKKLAATRPTAVNLLWALQKMKAAADGVQGIDQKRNAALQCAIAIKNEDIEMCRMIGVHGLELIKAISKTKNGEPVNILTHCNAGWLACVDWGTATSPIYHAQKEGINIHVWVDETRPRNQGANLTAFELGQQNINHTLIVDNTGGHLMQHGMVDMVIVGSDRVTAQGDVANKIGTYLKALAAKDNRVPFYAAMPVSTIDWNIKDGVKEIPIEQRDQNEVKYVSGKHEGKIKEVLICPETTPAANYGFDVTPSRLITGIITEKGISPASEEGLKKLYS
ncbi:MAG: methylthioribose-phosphate isomerase [Bacteroidetes bacterium]|nr:methylthioribose-phosphate isomerase [Bacteroidota bacterium]